MGQGTCHRLWRWHFYAALFISPLLITLAFSGIGYLFYTDVEKKAYADLFFGKVKTHSHSPLMKGFKKPPNNIKITRFPK